MWIQVIIPQNARNHILYLSSITAGFNKRLKHLNVQGVIKKSISPWASPIVVVPKKSAPGEAPRWRMCVDF